MATKRIKQSVITKQQDAYVEGILDGKSKSDAALDAGYSHASSSHTIERRAAVQQALAERREELSSATQITRAGVLNGILDAIEMARTMADPQAMLAGYRDISKMMGFNAPEVKKLEITASQGRLRHKMQSLSDEELLRLAEGEDVDGVIEGECRVVE
jgi:phage terminase small subunit